MVKPEWSGSSFRLDPKPVTPRTPAYLSASTPHPMKRRGCVRQAMLTVDSGPAGGYPTANGSCLHWVASIPANLFFRQKFLCASRLRSAPGVAGGASRFSFNSGFHGNSWLDSAFGG